jgi:hypothetical protein
LNGACGTGGTYECCDESGTFEKCCTVSGGSPILIDPKGEGFHLTGPSSSAMMQFRIHAADANPVFIDWTDPRYSNAWLVLPGADGNVRGLDQMFGNFMTPQPPSQNPNWYLALSEYDKTENGGNGDGVIGPEDAIWHDGLLPIGLYNGTGLKLWIGQPVGGASLPTDLHSPEQVGVYGFVLAYTDSPKTDQYGNQFRYRSDVYLDPARTRKDIRSYDVFLRSVSPVK